MASQRTRSHGQALARSPARTRGIVPHMSGLRPSGGCRERHEPEQRDLPRRNPHHGCHGTQARFPRRSRPGRQDPRRYREAARRPAVATAADRHPRRHRRLVRLGRPRQPVRVRPRPPPARYRPRPPAEHRHHAPGRHRVLRRLRPVRLPGFRGVGQHPEVRRRLRDRRAHSRLPRPGFLPSAGRFPRQPPARGRGRAGGLPACHHLVLCRRPGPHDDAGRPR